MTAREVPVNPKGCGHESWAREKTLIGECAVCMRELLVEIAKEGCRRLKPCNPVTKDSCVPCRARVTVNRIVPPPGQDVRGTMP